MFKTRTKPLAVVTVLLALVAICNVGCEDLFREASYFFDDVADVLDDVADDWDHHHDHDWEDTVDDILDDIEDWFD
jgi:hypothetical protein